MAPLVTVLIATKDRPEELRLTLSEMRKQRYPGMELLVIDDGSRSPVEPLVRQVWPDAVVVRHETNAGQCARRNEGFQLARGEFILQLDDDCSLIGENDLELAIHRLEASESAAGIVFYVINSLILPEKIETASLRGGCVAAFLGAAVLFRTSAIRNTAGYREFFSNEWEEEELGLQILGLGLKMIFEPAIVAHHRLSALNRNSARTWMRGLRNRIWAMVIHVPLPRLLPEVGWKILLGAWDGLRLLRPRLFLQALSQAVIGLPRAWRLRQPLSPIGLRRYDALRMSTVLSPAEFDDPPRRTMSRFLEFWRRWRNRARNRSAWDTREGDTGTSYTIAYAHEQQPVAQNPPPGPS